MKFHKSAPPRVIKFWGYLPHIELSLCDQLQHKNYINSLEKFWKNVNCKACISMKNRKVFDKGVFYK